jgi:hypothetical protein
MQFDRVFLNFSGETLNVYLKPQAIQAFVEPPNTQVVEPPNVKTLVPAVVEMLRHQRRRERRRQSRRRRRHGAVSQGTRLFEIVIV